MIELQQLQFRYPRSPFRLSIERLAFTTQAATAIVGPSGSGKTTLLHLLAGILTPDSGRITVGDTVVTDLTEKRRREFRLSSIGLVFQDFELLDYLSVIDNITLPCRLGPLPLSSSLIERAKQLLQEVGLADYARRSVTKLSQGERQRVAICRALLTSPGLLLADEPTGNLDPKTSTQILDLLLRLVKEQGATLLMVTHDHTVLSRFDQTVDFETLLAPSDEITSTGNAGASA